ncbi:hypothetical protein A6B35_31830 (plasmid) [Mesorhizobium amorphae CCNWGS0123]|nr:hypothetical protein A6B35_31830 [Mesorhizobium amorphae CCNWGS0123]
MSGANAPAKTDLYLHPPHCSFLGESNSDLTAGQAGRLHPNRQLELLPLDSAARSARYRNKGPIESGGWSIFMTFESDYERGSVAGARRIPAADD